MDRFFGASLQILTPVLWRRYPVIVVPLLALLPGFYGLLGIGGVIPLWRMGLMPAPCLHATRLSTHIGGTRLSLDAVASRG